MRLSIYVDMVKKMVTGPYHKRAPFETGELPLPNKPIIKEDGSISDEYLDVLAPIKFGHKPKFTETKNYLLDWCLEKLRE